MPSAARLAAIEKALGVPVGALLNQPNASAWQPIETAPKMRGVLLWADTSTPDFPNWRMGSGYFHDGMNVWIWEGEQVRGWAHPPTHWMPLPAPPTGAA